MPKCKLSRCNEEALPTGKRYCRQHKAEYLAKQKEQARIRETLPECTSCGDKLTLTAVRNGHTMCGECNTRKEEMERACKAAEARARVEQRKLDQLDACTSIDELKQFIKNHLL